MRYVKVVLSEQEIQILLGLLDAGIRAVGIQAVKSAATLLEQLDGLSFDEFDNRPTVMYETDPAEPLLSRVD